MSDNTLANDTSPPDYIKAAIEDVGTAMENLLAAHQRFYAEENNGDLPEATHSFQQLHRVAADWAFHITLDKLPDDDFLREMVFGIVGWYVGSLVCDNCEHSKAAVRSKLLDGFNQGAELSAPALDTPPPSKNQHRSAP